jgi:hypothetical protein
VPGARKEFKEKRREQKRSVRSKEISRKEAEVKCQKQGKNLGEKKREHKRSARSKEII